MMYRKTAQRGIAVLALVTIFALAGAQPAAAAGPGFLERLESFWSAVSGEPSVGLWDTVMSWFGGLKKTADTPVVMERSAGSDPNGIELTPAPHDPTASSVPD